MPAEFNELKAEFDKISKGKRKTFIVKPVIIFFFLKKYPNKKEASCQGRGIFLTRNLEDLNSTDHYVV